MSETYSYIAETIGKTEDKQACCCIIERRARKKHRVRLFHIKYLYFLVSESSSSRRTVSFHSGFAI